MSSLGLKIGKRYPLLRNLLVIQLVTVVCGVVLCYASYHWISNSAFRSELLEIKQGLKLHLDRVQEDLRTYQIFGMNDALEEAITDLKKRYPLADVKVVSASHVRPPLPEDTILSPEVADGVVDSVVVAKVDVAGLRGKYHANPAAYYLLFAVTGLFVIVILYSFQYIRTKIYNPIYALNRSFLAFQRGKGFSVEGIEAEGEIGQFIEGFKEIHGKLKNAERQAALHDISRQVAHDIRSPLAALEVIEASLSELPEDKRVLLRNATLRVRSIANTLLEKGQSGNFVAPPKDARDDEPCQSVLVSSLLESLTTEKRIQYRHRPEVKIQFEPTGTNYGVFIWAQTHMLKRVLSNLIDNAVEAIEGSGEVMVSVLARANSALIQVSDTGIGIPADRLHHILDSGASMGKAHGHGLGLLTAKRLIQKWNGKLEIRSTVGRGTVVTIQASLSTSPPWYVDAIRLSGRSKVVILDDDNLIHSLWRDRLVAAGFAADNETVLDFYSAQNFLEWFRNHRDVRNDCLYLFDYELVNQPLNGIEVMEQIGQLESAILVTSHFEEEPIRQMCEEKRVKLIPKGLAHVVPIQIQQAGDGSATRLTLISD
jgi:signal transduction histidine kinase